MRVASYLVLMALVGLALPAQAGNASFADGRGAWQSTQCVVPQPPAALSGNPEAAANDLNAQVAQHNRYVDEAQGYMNCVSQEAQRDADATSQMITRTAQGLIQQMQAQVGTSAAQLESRRAAAQR